MLPRNGRMYAALVLLSLSVLIVEAKKLSANINFCCKANEEISTSGECVPMLESNAIKLNPLLEVTSVSNDSITEINVFDYFNVIESRKPCESPYLWDENAEADIDDDWQLFANGTVFRSFDKTILKEGEFCLQYVLEDDAYVIQPYLCPIVAEEPTLELNLLPVSIACLILTAFVYLIVPKLRSNQFGKCFLFLLFAYVGGYLTLWLNLFNIESQLACELIGYFGYFFTMALIFQLVATIYVLWRKSVPNEEKKDSSIHLQLCTVLVWNAAGILTCILYLTDKLNLAYLDPSVGVYACWINTSDYWTGLVYLYAPMTILIICAIALLILTALNVRKYNLATKNHSQLDGSTTTYPNQLNASLLLRLAVIVVLWSFEVLQFYFGVKNFASKITFAIADGFNSCQGMIVFIMFVLNHTVFRTIIDWIKETRPAAEGYKESIRSQFLRQGNVSSPKTLI